MNVLTAGSTALVLALLVLVQPGAADVVAIASHLSTPPARTFLIDVHREEIGGLKLEAPASDYVKRLGIPDFIGQLETPKDVEMLWSRTAQPTTGWATAELKGPRSTTVVAMRFAGLFRTTRGDSRGTSLSAFLKHWRSQNPLVANVRMGGQVVEYNVVLGDVVFGFDTNATLQAVGLAPRGDGARLCVIPAACVVTRLR
jgi:hypothetical protein